MDQFTGSGIKFSTPIHESRKPISPTVIGEAIPRAATDLLILFTDFVSESSISQIFAFQIIYTKPMGHFIIVELQYKPTIGARSYFTRNFIRKEDVILYWVNEHARSSSSRTVSTLLINLGTPNTPPKKLITGIFALNQAEVCKKMIKEIDITLKVCDIISKDPDLSKDPKFEAYLETTRLYVEGERGRLAVEEDTRQQLLKIPPNLEVFDPLEMTCEIEFIDKHCSICRTTSHSVRECKKKTQGRGSRSSFPKSSKTHQQKGSRE
ncbi:hypothetical protein JCM33374_g387 [Metschnikowia sp. JCM 33374]|nr:hypothetical protein JCM33374_g387 [Metschnikowia sp. JCM 33374]